MIVITIIAVLAGAAIPYVQDYVDDARFARTRADLYELRNAIIRYETERGNWFNPIPANTFQTLLVGPYLQNSLVDPWGTPYLFNNNLSTVFSAGPDRDENTNVIAVDFRPPMAPTRAYWYDINNDGVINQHDKIRVRFTRPVKVFPPLPGDPPLVGIEDDTGNLGDSIPFVGSDPDPRVISISVGGVGVDLIPGRDSIIASGTKDRANNFSSSISVVIRPVQ